MTPFNSPYTVVLGLGATGLSCVRYLTRQGTAVAVVDTRINPPGLAELQQQFPSIPCQTGDWAESWLLGAQTIIVSPGISLQQPALQAAAAAGIPLWGDIELFARTVTKPVVAITGSNGKSTVTQLMGDLITASGYRAAVCGNIGVPVLDCLDAAVDFYVIELSSFQLETTNSLRPAAAVLLNLSADHMDRYATLSDYLRAKQRIYSGCQHAIVNADEPDTWQPLTFIQPPVTFSLDHQLADFYLGTLDQLDYLFYRDEPLIAVNALPYPERHNLQNALAALALGHSLHLPFASMLTGLQQFHSLAHRCQWVGEYAGIRWYNDSKATNVGAAIAAITSLGRHTSGQIILIAGGDSKCADLTPLKGPISQYVKHAILLGKDADLLEATLAHDTTITRVDNLLAAIPIAASLAAPQDIVLLSPACSSLDQFKNFEERGTIFTAAVKAYYQN